MNPVGIYWEAFKASGLDPDAFARHMIATRKALCLQVLEVIGSWPSSEVELRALQRAWRG